MNFIKVATYDNYLMANMALGLLQENEINCHLKDEYIVTIDPLLNPAVGGIKMMVAETDLEKALGILKEAEAAYIGSIPCPYCHSRSLVLEEKTNRPNTVWGLIKNMVAFGQAETHSKLYRCGHCQSVLTELPATY
jgi:DNA-directed RNA polymerase subunit RPC12/RpoP